MGLFVRHFKLNYFVCLDILSMTSSIVPISLNCFLLKKTHLVNFKENQNLKVHIYLIYKFALPFLHPKLMSKFAFTQTVEEKTLKLILFRESMSFS